MTVVPQLIFNIADRADVTDTDIENAHKLLDYYIGSVGNISEKNIQGMVDMYTDAWFAYGHHRTVNYLTQYGVPTFQYIFAYPGQLSFFNLAFIKMFYTILQFQENFHLQMPLILIHMVYVMVMS